MEYLSCAETAKEYGTTVRRIQQMCKEGKIPGAEKHGHSWFIPNSSPNSSPDSIPNNSPNSSPNSSPNDIPNSIPNSSPENISPNISKEIQAYEKKPLPVGVSDFKSATTNYYYVDKTLLIKEFLDTQPKVSLFTRPRRFGKTLNMDMLRVFFEKAPEDTSIYFKDKRIWQYGEAYTKHQGKYPVIFLTFKDVKCQTWKDTLQKIKSLVALEFMRHSELETSPRLTAYEKELYHRLASDSANEIDCQMGLQLLSLLLHKHYDKECIIIIDEYDTPIQQGHSCNFYSSIVNFMRNFFSGGLKDNPHLAFGFLTGILRVAKESIFSGLNNLKTDSLLDENYSKYFGFTAEEVKQMLKYYCRTSKFHEICEWYDGYKFGNTEIFNPWSVINYISDSCFPKAFWQFTGSNEIIGEILASANSQITEDLYRLLTGDSITTYVDTNVIYPEVQNNPYSIYSFLLMAGYLKVVTTYPQSDGNFMCNVAIPNKEIAFVYEKEILNKTNQNSVSISISQAIFSQDEKKLQNLLEDFLLKSISSLDGANESFYHGLMLGLCAVLGNKYRVQSNRESGFGRFDIQLTPKVNGMPGFIFEFKHTRDVKADLDALAESALCQIEQKKYDSELLSLGVGAKAEAPAIIKIGIAFRGKSAVVRRTLKENLKS